MRLISYRKKDAEHVGVMRDETRFVSLSESDAAFPSSLKALLAQGAPLLARARSLATPGPVQSIDEVTLAPVIPDPGAIWCVGLNYRSHMEETGRSDTEHPTLFLRLPRSQVAHRAPIVRPVVSTHLDFEGELAVVIGHGGRHIAIDRAMEHVGGYACYNEATIRDWQRHTSQWGPGKTFQGTGAFGPWLVTPDEFGEPGPQQLVTRLNGQEMQRTTLALMIFDIPMLISYISRAHALEPGDVIVTGTPAGIGNKRVPPIFMQPGDLVSVEIEGIGTLENPIAAESEEPRS